MPRTQRAASCSLCAPSGVVPLMRGRTGCVLHAAPALDAGDHGHLADTHRQDEMHFALHGFLVVHQAREQVLRGDAVDRRDRAVAVDQFQDFDAVLGGEMAGALCQVHGGAHAPGHRFAMQEARVAGLRFERVAEGVAEVQDAAEVAFALVGRDYFAFMRTDSAMMWSTASGVRAQDRVAMLAPGIGTAARSRMTPALMIS